MDIRLEKLTYGGDAMGRLEDGRAVFVPFGLPGERVRIRLTEERRSFARARWWKSLKPPSSGSFRAASISGSAAGAITSIFRIQNN